MDVYELISSAEERFGNRTVIIEKGRQINYAEVKENSFKLANALYDSGLRKGDKVAVYLPNRAEYFYIYYACYITGIIIVPIDFYLSEDEIVNIIDHCGVKLIFAQNSPRSNLASLIHKSGSLKTVVSLDEKPQFTSFDNLIEKASKIFKKVHIDKDNYSSIFCTSGTTGKPKGVLWNYRHIHIGCDALEYFLHDFMPGRCTITAIPFSHSAGLLSPMGALKLGISSVVLDHFHPIEFLKVIEKWKVNGFWMVPPMWYALLFLKDIAQFDLTSVEFAAVFGATSDPEMIKRTNKYFPNCTLFTGWGMTEVIPPTTVCEPNRIENVGKPYPWVNLKIVDESGKEKYVNEIGELCAKGEGVFLGYYNEPEQTAELFDDGWFKTGDLAKVDKDGNYHIVGKTKDMLKVGGQIVWCAEVENVLMKHHCVHEVATIGVPDKLRGEVPMAFIVLKEGIVLPEKYILEFASEHLAKFKIPKAIRYVNDLPKTGSGKIDKAKLKEMALH